MAHAKSKPLILRWLPSSSAKTSVQAVVPSLLGRNYEDFSMCGLAELRDA